MGMKEVHYFHSKGENIYLGSKSVAKPYLSNSSLAPSLSIKDAFSFLLKSLTSKSSLSSVERVTARPVTEMQAEF
jgi:hypothetical protein